MLTLASALLVFSTLPALWFYSVPEKRLLIGCFLLALCAISFVLATDMGGIRSTLQSIGTKSPLSAVPDTSLSPQTDLLVLTQQTLETQTALLPQNAVFWLTSASLFLILLIGFGGIPAMVGMILYWNVSHFSVLPPLALSDTLWLIALALVMAAFRSRVFAIGASLSAAAIPLFPPFLVMTLLILFGTLKLWLNRGLWRPFLICLGAIAVVGILYAAIASSVYSASFWSSYAEQASVTALTPFGFSAKSMLLQYYGADLIHTHYSGTLSDELFMSRLSSLAEQHYDIFMLILIGCGALLLWSFLAFSVGEMALYSFQMILWLIGAAEPWMVLGLVIWIADVVKHSESRSGTLCNAGIPILFLLMLTLLPLSGLLLPQSAFLINAGFALAISLLILTRSIWNQPVAVEDVPDYPMAEPETLPEPAPSKPANPVKPEPTFMTAQTSAPAPEPKKPLQKTEEPLSLHIEVKQQMTGYGLAPEKLAPERPKAASEPVKPAAPLAPPSPTPLTQEKPAPVDEPKPAAAPAPQIPKPQAPAGPPPSANDILARFNPPKPQKPKK